MYVQENLPTPVSFFIPDILLQFFSYQYYLVIITAVIYKLFEDVMNFAIFSTLMCKLRKG